MLWLHFIIDKSICWLLFGILKIIRCQCSLRSADAFPVVASLPRRERSDDRKCVCDSQAIVNAPLKKSQTFWASISTVDCETSEIAVYSDACTNSQYQSSREHRWLCRINYKGLCGTFSASLWSLCFTYCTFLVFFTVSERFQRVLIGCALLWHRLTCEPTLPVQIVACLDALWYSYAES